MNKSILGIACSLALIFSACTDDELPNPQKQNPCDNFLLTTSFNDTCFELPQPRPPEIVETGEYAFLQPSFDRNNPHKLLYIQSRGEGTYWIVDLCKNEYTKLMDGFLFGKIRPQLGQNGWVAYCTTLEELMIKKIGEENAVHIAQEYQCTRPFWLTSENRLICQAEVGNGVYKTLSINPDGPVIEEIDTPPSVIFSEYQQKITARSGPFNETKIGYLDMQADYAFIEVFALPSVNQQPIHMDWLDETHIIWTDAIGLHKVNILTGEMITLKENCGNRAMAYFSIPPNRDGTIILDQTNYTPEEDGLNKDISIHRYDTNTGIQERFELEPQF